MNPELVLTKDDLDQIFDQISSGNPWGQVRIYGFIAEQRDEIVKLREALEQAEAHSRDIHDICDVCYQRLAEKGEHSEGEHADDCPFKALETPQP